MPHSTNEAEGPPPNFYDARVNLTSLHYGFERWRRAEADRRGGAEPPQPIWLQGAFEREVYELIGRTRPNHPIPDTFSGRRNAGEPAPFPI